MYLYVLLFMQPYLIPSQMSKSSKQAVQSQKKLAEESLKGFETD